MEQHPIKNNIQELFLEQLQANPEAPALEDSSRSLSYRELNDWSNQICYKLECSGVHPGEPVGVLLNRSLEFVVAILGILKAGCCYVPIDRKLPKKRLRYMLEDAALKTVIEDYADFIDDHVFAVQVGTLGQQEGAVDLKAGFDKVKGWVDSYYSV